MEAHSKCTLRAAKEEVRESGAKGQRSRAWRAGVAGMGVQGGDWQPQQPECLAQGKQEATERLWRSMALAQGTAGTWTPGQQPWPNRKSHLAGLLGPT